MYYCLFSVYVKNERITCTTDEECNKKCEDRYGQYSYGLCTHYLDGGQRNFYYRCACQFHETRCERKWNHNEVLSPTPCTNITECVGLCTKGYVPDCTDKPYPGVVNKDNTKICQCHYFIETCEVRPNGVQIFLDAEYPVFGN